MYLNNPTLQTIFMGLVCFSSVLSFGSAAFMWRMRATFVPRPEVEARFDTMQDSITAFDARLREVEKGGSSISTGIVHLGEGINRIDHMMGLLIEHRLRESEGG